MGAAPYNGTILPLTYQNPAPATVSTTSEVLVTAGQFSRSLTIATLPGSTTSVWLNPSGELAIVGSGHLVAADGGSFTFGSAGTPIPTGPITAITDGDTPQPVALAGG